MTVCVITGGGRGIVAATALRFAATGSSLVLTWKGHEASAQSVADRCRERGVRAVAVQADVAQEPDVAALCERADELGPLSALINNAGVVGSSDLSVVMGSRS